MLSMLLLLLYSHRWVMRMTGVLDLPIKHIVIKTFHKTKKAANYNNSLTLPNKKDLKCKLSTF